MAKTAPPAQAPGRKRTVASARCPRPLHRERQPVANGRRTVGERTVRQFLCSRGATDAHTFTVTIGDTRPVAVHREPCPECPFHPEGHVVRYGPYLINLS